VGVIAHNEINSGRCYADLVLNCNGVSAASRVEQTSVLVAQRMALPVVLLWKWWLVAATHRNKSGKRLQLRG